MRNNKTPLLLVVCAALACGAEEPAPSFGVDPNKPCEIEIHPGGIGLLLTHNASLHLPTTKPSNVMISFEIPTPWVADSFTWLWDDSTLADPFDWAAQDSAFTRPDSRYRVVIRNCYLLQYGER